MTATPRPTVVVVGAGISGLAAAWTLIQQRADLDVVILEAAGTVGGKLALLEVGGLTVDAGAEALLARRPEAVDLARAVGLGEDLVTPQTTAAGIWSRGTVSDLPSGTLMGVPAGGAAALGVLTAAEAADVDAEPTRPIRPLDHDVDVASYVRSRVGPAVVDRLVEPLLGGVYAGHADRLSLQATVPALWSAAHGGTSLLDAVQQAGRRSSTLAAGPVFAGIRGGVGRLPIAVADALTRAGGVIRLGATVRAVRRTPTGWELVLGSRADEELLRADAVVLALPARPAGRLLAEIDVVAAQRVSAIEPASMALVTVVLPGLAAAVDGRRSGVLVPPIEGRLVKAVTYSSVKWGWLADAAGPDLVVRMSVGRQGEEADLQRDDAELTALARTDLGSLLGRALPEPSASAVVRWGGALPQYAVGHVDLVAEARSAVAGIAGLALCGSYLDGLGVPACIAAAASAATKILADLVPSPEGGVPPPAAGDDAGRRMPS